VNGSGFIEPSYTDNGEESIMVICPKCKAENRSEAAFCVRCGTILFARPSPSKPATASTESEVKKEPVSAEPLEKVVFPKTFAKRPDGTIFSERFKYESVSYKSEHENHYIVSEIDDADYPGVRVCTNPACRTIHVPMGDNVEKYCTQCGQPLQQEALVFQLKEADTDKYTKIQPILDLHLIHPNISPPIAAFQESVNSTPRYYVVEPISKDLPYQPELSEVLDWGIHLSRALDYMQAKGVVLGEMKDEANMGFIDGKIVWSNFETTRVLPMLTDREKINNLRYLALAMYSWITGKTTYSLDPYLPPMINEIFQIALDGEGFTSGAQFEQHIRLAKSTNPSRLNLDYQTGKRTHPGKVRKNNEDSVLSIELSRMNQGIIQPICLAAVADGMGGHASGELASSLVIDAIAQIGAFEMVALQNPSFEEFDDWVKRALHSANQAVFEARKDAGNDMGSTLVLGLIIGSQAYFGHVGDSRIYLINNESIKQLSTDHSLVQHLVSIGKISPDEARTHPQRNVIYRSLGEKAEVEADFFSQQIFPQDRLLFCTDGLTNLVEDENIFKIIMDSPSPQAACDRLVEEANNMGGDDNISVLLLEVLAF
jgi:serine/threonine protein phosphatase PrpC